MAMDEEFVEIARAVNAMEAQVIRGLLESRGIRCLIRAHVVPDLHPYSLGPMAESVILVRASDAERARKLLPGAMEIQE